MNDFKALTAFVRVVELGSVSAAARDQGLSQPAMSRLIAGLERKFGTRLLERDHDGMRVTEEGRIFYAGSRGLIEDLEQLRRRVKDQTEHAIGSLRITASVAMCLLHVRHWVQAFLERHPDVQIDLDADDRRAKLVAEEFDIALRFGPELPEDHVARPLATSARVLVASPALLSRFGPPLQPADLSALPFVNWVADLDTTKLRLTGPAGETVVRVSARLGLTCGVLVRDAVCEGAGIGQLPLYLVDEALSDGRLIRLLPEWRCPPADLHAIYPSRKYLPQRVRLFLDFVGERVAHARGFEAHGSTARAVSSIT